MQTTKFEHEVGHEEGLKPRLAGPASLSRDSERHVLGATVAAPQFDATSALLRVWLVIAAVWLVFWAPVASLLFAMLEARPDGLAFLGVLVLAPPLALLAAGAAAMLAADAFRTLAASRRRRAASWRRVHSTSGPWQPHLVGTLGDAHLCIPKVTPRVFPEPAFPRRISPDHSA